MQRPASIDRLKQNRLVLALKRAVEATFNESAWRELGYATDSSEWINAHPRLLRSLDFGDGDYGSHVMDAVEFMVKRDPSSIEVILDFRGIREWLRENESQVFSEFCGGDTPAVGSLADAQDAARGFDVDGHIRRIRESLVIDPALAVGSTKELLETVFKTILGLHGSQIGNDNIPTLLKRTQVALQIDPADVDQTLPGGEALRKLFSSMANIVLAVAELRNLYGTGHGKHNAPALDLATSNLVVAAGTSLAAYLMQRYQELQRQSQAIIKT